MVKPRVSFCGLLGPKDGGYVALVLATFQIGNSLPCLEEAYLYRRLKTLRLVIALLLLCTNG